MVNVKLRLNNTTSTAHFLDLMCNSERTNRKLDLPENWGTESYFRLKNMGERRRRSFRRRNLFWMNCWEKATKWSSVGFLHQEHNPKSGLSTDLKPQVEFQSSQIFSKMIWYSLRWFFIFQKSQMISYFYSWSRAISNTLRCLCNYSSFLLLLGEVPLHLLREHLCSY